MKHPSSCLAAFGFAVAALMAGGTASAVELDLKRLTPVPADQPIPVQDFLRSSFMRQPSLNRTGTHVFSLVSAGEDKTNVMLFELKTKAIEIFGTPGDSDCNQPSWLDATRVTFGISAKKGGAFELCMADVGHLTLPKPLLINIGARIFAVPPENRRYPLANLTANGPLTGKYGEVVEIDATVDVGKLIDPSAGRSWDPDETNLTNERHVKRRFPILETPGGFDLYYMADKAGSLAFAVTSTEGVLALNRFTGTGWEKCPQDLDEVDLFGVGDNPGEVVVLGPRGGGKPRTLQFVEAATNKPGEILLEDAAYDFNGWLYRDPVSHNIVGAIFDRAGPQVVWFTEAYRVLQKAVDALFPGQVARIIGTDDTGKIVLLSVFSDKQPEVYRWVNLADRTAGDIQRSRPWIDPARMQPMSVIKYKTADGKKLDAYVTMPAGASKQNPPPLIVLPVGNGARATWGYNDLAQFFASRGYAVLQPNHRGSTGYSWMFPVEDEWDFRKMHEDTTAAVKALISAGLVNGKRVGILGQSFAGFLALQGAAYEPDLYKCAIALGPVCDWARAVQEDKYFKYSDPSVSRVLRKLGDPSTNAAKFEAISPLRHASAVKAAVLIAYGEYENSGLISQDRDFVSAVKGHGVPAEIMSFTNEGGYISHLDHRVELFTRIESFLAEHMK